MTAWYSAQYDGSDQSQPFGLSMLADRNHDGAMLDYIRSGGRLSDFIAAKMDADLAISQPGALK